DDAKKEHPCLTSYDKLPESEKQFNRNAALETIKALMSLGYSKEKFNSEAFLAQAGEFSEKSAALIAQFKKPTLTVAELRRLWIERVPLLWLRNVAIYRRAVDA